MGCFQGPVLKMRIINYEFKRYLRCGIKTVATLMGEKAALNLQNPVDVGPVDGVGTTLRVPVSCKAQRGRRLWEVGMLYWPSCQSVYHLFLLLRR